MSKVAHNLKDKARTGDVLITESVDFGSLLLSEPVLRGLKNSGFIRPSPIQLKAIPLGRCGLDLIVQAKSGTGKTCVFSVIALESIVTDTASTQVLVLAPTREIAVQIWEVIKSIGSGMKELECHTFIGGLPLHEDRMKLKKCHIAVGSPGRIKQLIEGGVLKTDSVRLFILDEADKLLEESFQEQINWIYSALPENKQMLALSATYPEYLADHLTAYMRNPTFLRLNISDPALLGIRQYFHTVPYHPMSHVVFEEKSKVLINILSSVSFEQCLVFSNLQTRAQTLAESLTSHGWPTACIAGCLDQKDRNHAMARLKTYKCRILISTDLTSRGIDADKVNMVINLDVPNDHETYLHRIGRAGRFGSFGIAITLISDGKERLDLDSIEKRCNTQIHLLPDPLPSDLAKPDGPVFLDDVVSSEVINTMNHRSPKNSPTKLKEKSPLKSRAVEIENDIKNVNGTSDRASVQSSDSNGINVVECHDVENTDENEDTVVTVNGVTKKGLLTEGDLVSKHDWKNDFEEHVDTRDAVIYEGVEYNEIGELEFGIGETKDTGYDKYKNGLTDSTVEENGDVFEQQPQLKGESISLSSGDVDGDKRIRDTVNVAKGERVNYDLRACRHEELLPNGNVLKSDNDGPSKLENQMVHKVLISDVIVLKNDIEGSSKNDDQMVHSVPISDVNVVKSDNEGSSKENQKAHNVPISDVMKGYSEGSSKSENQMVRNVSLSDLSLRRNCKISSLPVRNINIYDVFKNNTGFKRLDKSHSYGTAKESLKAFRDKVDTDEELMDNGFDCSVPKIDCDNSETDTLRQAVSQLQELLENRLTIYSTETSNVIEVIKEVGNEEASGNNSISSEDEFEAKFEMLNRKSNSPLPSLSPDVEDKQTCDKDIPAELEVYTALEKKFNGAQEEDKRNKNDVQKARRKRFGYRGNFAIGHLLQQERARELENENNLNELNHLEGAEDAQEAVNSKDSEPDTKAEMNIPELEVFAGNTQAENACENNRFESETTTTDEQNSTALRRAKYKVIGDLKMKMENKDNHVNRIDAEDDKESDSETSSVSSVTDSESTDSEQMQDKGARPKTYNISRKTQSRDVRQDNKARSCKQGRSISKSSSKSTDGDVDSRPSYQDQWRQWYEQYDNWHQQSMNMWDYPGTYENHVQNGNRKADMPNYGYPSGHYPAPSMYYPYHTYHQGYPYSYPQYYTPYSQQPPNSNFSEQVGNAFQFQEEYLKQMSKYWKKEKVKK